jgi:metal-sulfur cluster biosynthetic enzyme
MSPTAETVRAALADVFDPEAEISILDMGLCTRSRPAMPVSASA